MNSQTDGVRSQFPALNSADFVYLDSAASTLKCLAAVERVQRYLSFEAANVHRGSYALSDKATTFYEEARKTVGQFLSAASAEEVIFTRNTTESLNLLAHALEPRLLSGDEIVLTELEHHSNIVPWQMLAARTGARIRVARVTQDGQIDWESYLQVLSPRTRIVSIQMISNALGTIHPVQELIAQAREVGALVVLDAAQAVSSQKVNVQSLDCDFLCFSGHKLFAADGIGVLWGRQALLNEMPPFLGGGSMIDRVDFAGTTYLKAPFRFEAGTPNVSGALSLAAAVEFLGTLGWEQVDSHERALLQRAEGSLREIPQVRVLGDGGDRRNVISFLVEGLHPADVGFFLGQQGVYVRAGHHCCQPLMKALGVPGTVRASFSIYNNEADVDRFVNAVRKSLEFL